MKTAEKDNITLEVLPPNGEQRVHAVATTQSGAVTPLELLRYALDSGADLDRLERLFELQKNYEANEARKAYVAAMAEFKKSPPKIIKDKQVEFDSRNGVTSYAHATLGNVTSTIVDALAKYGFSHRWDTKQASGMIAVTCILTHTLGHSESTTLESGMETSGTKNAIQSLGSAITYLERYTLQAACGLATHDKSDDDGHAAGLDTNLADKWIAQARAAKSQSDLHKVWLAGSNEIGMAGDKEAYRELTAVVIDCQSALPQVKKEPNKSSRLSDIVGAKEQS